MKVHTLSEATVHGGRPTAEGGAATPEEALAELGGIDVLINTGPADLPRGVSPSAPQDVERALAESMSLLVTSTEAALPAMGPGASIINTVLYSSPSRGTESALEALAGAVLDTTQGWAEVLARRGIRVNAVAAAPTRNSTATSQAGPYLLGAPVDDDEELDVFVYLASQESCRVTGSILGVSRDLQDARLAQVR
ncbi:SDR family oxidoreductase [Sinomonas mesophila]|uniref:SDR family oxidoreductase n=1 Tax=Sinomonas mesophila TaxID=1531955 RepID=UPI00158C065A|nr:SDR family oxidoreductase [Sinomonas mesophila]